VYCFHVYALIVLAAFVCVRREETRCKKDTRLARGMGSRIVSPTGIGPGVASARLSVMCRPGGPATDGLLAQFGRRRTEARRRYRKFVAEDGASVWSGPRQQIYLADDASVAKMQEKVPVQTDQLNVPRSQRRRPAPPREAILAEHPGRNIMRDLTRCIAC
jgi:hypothetical protein